MSLFQSFRDAMLTLLGLKRIEFEKIKFFPRHRIVEYALDTARDGTQRIYERGFSIKVVELDGDCKIYVGEKKEKSFDLSPQMEIDGFFKAFYLEHDAQSGKTLKIAIGLDPPFRVKYYERYSVEMNVSRGGDDTEVVGNTTSYVLKKTITIESALSKNTIINEINYKLRQGTGGTRAWSKISVESPTVSETTEDEYSTTSDSYVYRLKSLSQEYFGAWVKIRVYLKDEGGAFGSYNSLCQLFGKTYGEIHYL